MSVRTHITRYGDVMDAASRVSRLVQTLRRDGRVDVAHAAAEFGAAEMTIRRDLELLVERGVARRVRGGAVSLLMRGDELPFAMREIESVDAKQRIGRFVAGLIDDGEAVGFDTGTTVLEVARAVAGRRITTMPMSLHAALALAGTSSVRLIMPGGEVRPGELAIAGPAALAAIAGVRFDTVVLGCCGVTPDGLVTAFDLADAAVKQALLASGRRSVLALDASKFSHAAMAVVAAAADFDVVVTDHSAPPAAVDPLEAAGVAVHRV